MVCWVVCWEVCCVIIWMVCEFGSGIGGTLHGPLFVMSGGMLVLGFYGG